jgi:hypothetical protein
MNFFKRLFKRTKTSVECPRCLGKGHVDMSDIKRLGNELRWVPGKCAYCNAIGSVQPETISKVAAGEPYLTNNLPKAERNRVINGDEAALKRGAVLEARIGLAIQQIKQLYFERNLNVEEIAELFLQSTPEWGVQEKKEMIEYINKVIAHSIGTQN